MSVLNPNPLQWAHPLIQEWFSGRFGKSTEPQEAGWPSIANGKATLIAAPTGSGKTLAAFLVCIDQLVRKALTNQLRDETEIIYISPLKALSNDVQKNLEQPLTEIIELATQKGYKMLPIRTAVRTGDTLSAERQAILRKPPHILVTTPESFYLLLTAEKSRKIMRTVNTVIIDEIHAIADDKRGAHLTLSLERLEQLTEKKPLRIGLSATQKPIELTAQFMVGSKRKLPIIIDVGHKRQLDLLVEVPKSPLAAVTSNEVWDEIYDRIVELVNENRSTLVFVNTRKQAERVTMNLAKRLGEDTVATHHGSLSRKVRLAAEHKLKNGQIKVLVATASLELGIDIGSVDLVCQLGSPRSISTALQRIGRAGHWYGAVPKGRIFATTRDELLEIAALTRAIMLDDLDELIVPDKPLDILSQQIVAMCAVEEWQEDDLYSILRQAYPYRNLTKTEYRKVLHMLSEGISARRGRYGSYLLHDQVNGKLKGRRGARLAAITSGGAIPESNLYQVIVEPEGTNIGTLDEDFAVESNKGDVILLGNNSWRIRRVESKGRVLVEDAHGAAPTVPFWLGEGPARTKELSEHVSVLRETVGNLCAAIPVNFVTEKYTEPVDKAIGWLKKECKVDDSGAEQIIEYITEGKSVLGAIPSNNLVIAERFFDEGGGMQLIIHAPFGARINKAWGLALRKKFCRSFNFELQAAATDNGLNISLGEQHSFPLADIFYYLTANNIRETLIQAALAAPVFTTRWRWDATRSLALLRFMGGKKVPPYIQRLRSDDLLAAVFPAAAACQDNQVGDIDLPDHPLIDEVIKDVLTEAMDVEGLEKVVTGITNGAIKCLAIDTPIPSVFSHEILNANPYAYLDDAPLEERRARAVEIRRILPEVLLKEIGALDKKAINNVLESAWPHLRNADELHDFLQTVIALPEQLSLLGRREPQEAWPAFLSQLQEENRVTVAIVSGTKFWLCAERVKHFLCAYPEAIILKNLPPIEGVSEVNVETAISSIVQGWMNYCGPISTGDLSRLLKLPEKTIILALLQLESSGVILRGKYTDEFLHLTGSEPQHWQWCDRRLLARIHRATVSTLRKEVESVPASIFLSWLSCWQHAAPGTQLSGERGTLEVLRQLQGFEIPANAWEREILCKRINRYDPAILDRLCMIGAVGWGRLSRSGVKRVIPSSVAPITFFVRDEADWMIGDQNGNSTVILSGAANTVKAFLEQRGASFFADIVRGTGLLKAEVETALWELVAAGFVTADGFDNLRALIDPKRRTGQGRGRHIRPRHSLGRWVLLPTDELKDRSKVIEATCLMLLKRYGVFFRELLARESTAFKWRELLQVFRLLEARGEIRSGIFVNGFLGEQFALPEALESLRIFRHKNHQNGQHDLNLSATDPLNLIGIILPGDRVPAFSGKFVKIQSSAQFN